MENKRRALGKGLEELFNIEDINYNKIEEKIIEDSSKEEIVDLNLDELRVNPYQPRKTFDEEALNELAESIKEHGVIQPIIVKKSIKGYEIVAGERRYRASKLVGKKTIPAIIREFTDDQMMEIAVLENLQRENLNAIEEAEAYLSLMNKLNLTQEEVAKRVGKSRSHITNLLGILSLPADVKELVKDNKISMAHARTLSKIEDEEKIELLADKVINENMSVRDLEQETRKKEFKKKVVQNTNQKTKEYQDVENGLSEYLGTKVRISKNKVEISYANESDLNRILEIINYNK